MVDAISALIEALVTIEETGERLWEPELHRLKGAFPLDGGAREAHDLFAPVYGWFTEGFDIADLEEAKTLLEEVKGGTGGSGFVLPRE